MRRSATMTRLDHLRLPAWAALALGLLVWSPPAAAQSTGFDPPPRTIADVTAILDQQKPAPAMAEKLRAAADAVPAANIEPAALARFYYRRAQDRYTVGRLDEAIADDRLALQLGENSVDRLQIGLMQQFLGFSLRLAGHPHAAAEAFLQIERSIAGPGSEARLVNTYRQLVELYLVLGNVTKAESYVDKAKALIEP